MGEFAVSADGVQIHYERVGQGEPALVFVHGWCCDQSYWHKQTDTFAPRYTVVAIDLAGHGQSGLARDKWTMAAFARDVVAVVEQLGLRQIILIGHSMGGPVIVEAARLMPNRVIGLVGADTLLNPERQRTQEEIETRVRFLRADFRQATTRLVRDDMFVPTSDPVWAQSIVEDMASAPPHVGVGAMHGLLSNDEALHAGLREVKAPIVLINADYHPTNFEATNRAGITVELMAGVGHFVMNEDAETFNRLLDAAVQKMVKRGIEQRIVSSDWCTILYLY